MEVNYRKIDIDQYDEDVLLESELYEADPRDPAQVLSDTKQKAVAVRSSLSKYACFHRLQLLAQFSDFAWFLLQGRYSWCFNSRT